MQTKQAQLAGQTTANKAGRRGRRSIAEANHNRKQIMAAALSCFARLGYKSTTNQIIAREAGLSSGAIYNHFTSKSELYVAVFEQAEAEISQFHQGLLNNVGDSKKALLRIISESKKMYVDKPDLARFLSQVSVEAFHYPELTLSLAEKMKGTLTNTIKEIIVLGQKNKEINHSLTAEQVANLYITASMGMAQTSLFYGQDYYLKSMDDLQNILNASLFRNPNDHN